MTPRTSGPRVVALGGGHGTANTLRAARRYASEVTAIVSVADDGGSSGRLRQALGIPAPGDLRRCLVALSEKEEGANPLARAFDHRFSAEAGDLEGHALGNLLIAGLADALGSFTAALDEAARLLGAEGRVLPATAEPVALKAVSDSGEVHGQVAVQNAGRIAHVSIVPADARPPDAAIDAIARADQLVLGPGSLFTSVLAVLAVPAVREAVNASTAPVVYVCNLRAGPETDGYDVAAHAEAVIAHGVSPDVVLYDPSAIEVGLLPVPGLAAELAARPGTGTHDPVRLARALAGLVG
jgi:uncharacterized cofD-like protein